WAEQTSLIVCRGVCVVVVHVFQDGRLRGREFAGIDVEQQLAALDPVNPPETGDEVPAFDTHSVEVEVGKPGIGGTRRMMRGEASATARVIGHLSLPDQGEAGARGRGRGNPGSVPQPPNAPTGG